MLEWCVYLIRETVTYLYIEWLADCMRYCSLLFR